MQRFILLAVIAAVVAGAIWLVVEQRDEAPAAGSVALPGHEGRDLSSFTGAELAARTPTASTLEAAHSVDPAPEAAATLELQLRHADGVPARGCAVAIAAGEKVAWASFADGDGLVRGAAVSGPAVAWVAGATLMPVSFDLPEARGRHELSLPAGEVIDGRVEIDGRPPPDALLLGLAPHDPVDVPKPVLDALRIQRPGFAVPNLDESWGCLVEGDGSFRFSGLPAGWDGRFEIPYTYFVDDDHALHVGAPEHGRVLALHRVPHLHFRVVSAGAREPVPFAQATVTSFGAGNTTMTGLACGADGRGDAAMLRFGETLSVLLELTAPDKSAGVSRNFDLAIPERPARSAQYLEPPAGGRDVDLGDVELKPRSSIPFHVTDIGGASLQGAVGGTECEVTVRSKPTGADGLGRLDGVPPGCLELLVGAAAHEMARVPLPPQTPSEPIEVALTPCATLSVHLVSDDGAPRSGLSLVVTTSRHLSVADAASGFHDTVLRLSTHPPDAGGGFRDQDERQSDGSLIRSRRQSWALRALGDFDFGCVDAGTDVVLELVDNVGHSIWSETVRLKEGEHRVVPIVVSARPSMFELLVTDKAGAALEGVEVSARPSDVAEGAEDDNDYRWESSATGSVQIGAYAALVDVRCEKQGYVPATLKGVQPGVLGHVVMQDGLSVTVHCTGPDGQPALAGGVTCGHDECQAEDVDPALDESGFILGSATWRLSGLQPGAMTIVVQAGGRSFSFDHDAGETEVTLRLPAFGALRVHGLQPAKDLAASLVRVFPEDSDKNALFRRLDLGKITRDSVTLPLIFPGRYRVELAGGDRDTRRLRGPVLVEVRAGETVEVTLP